MPVELPEEPEGESRTTVLAGECKRVSKPGGPDGLAGLNGLPDGVAGLRSELFGLSARDGRVKPALIGLSCNAARLKPELMGLVCSSLRRR